MHRAGSLTWGSGLVLLAAVASVTSCSSAGDLSIVNNSDDAVIVDLGDERFEITADGGAVIHDYGCTAGDIAVHRASGEVVTVGGPICSDQQVIVDGDGVRLIAAD